MPPDDVELMAAFLKLRKEAFAKLASPLRDAVLMRFKKATQGVKTASEFAATDKALFSAHDGAVMSKMPSIKETVEKVLEEVDSTYTKIASSIPVDSRPPLKKLASKLRELPDPVLSYEVLHVVKTAMIEGTLQRLGPFELTLISGEDPSSKLHKLANALRAEDLEDQEHLLAKGAHILRATRGLMLLRELVRE